MNIKYDIPKANETLKIIVAGKLLRQLIIEAKKKGFAGSKPDLLEFARILLEKQLGVYKNER